MDIYFKFVGK